MVKKYLLALVAMIPMYANAQCWVVDGLKGATFSQQDNYKMTNDGYSGTFIIKTNGEDASVVYSGFDDGTMQYKSLHPNTIIGLSIGDNTYVSESWVIQPNGIVTMSKVIYGFGDLDSTKSMVGSVAKSCN